MFPYFRKHNIKTNEIVSDYRQPRPGDGGDCCRPGEWGYESIVPKDLCKSQWVKCMNSPIWIRENGGKKDIVPGAPYADSKAFGDWIEDNIGSPDEVTPVIFGITIDCCVLCTIAEFRWRGYEPIVIREAVDHNTGNLKDRDIVLEKTAIRWWSKVMDWAEFEKMYS